MNLRVVFMGTPEFSVPTLVALYSGFHVIGVVTQPDKPKGRGLRIVPTAVKKKALELNLPVIEPPRIAAPEVLEVLAQWKPDIIVVAAYGKILPESILQLPPKGCVNLHASLLPTPSGSSSHKRGNTCRRYCDRRLYHSNGQWNGYGRYSPQGRSTY